MKNKSPSSKFLKKANGERTNSQSSFFITESFIYVTNTHVNRTGCHFFCWVMWQPVLCAVQNSYAGWAWLMCAKFEWPTVHHTITHNQHNTTKNNKHWHHDLPRPLASCGFHFRGEYDRCMLRNQSQSMQHGDVIIIDETNIFFLLLTIILQVLDRHAHELKVSYFSAYLLFFLAVASKQCTLTMSICWYYNPCCPPSPRHVLAWFRTSGARRHCHRAFTHTQVPW